jgi:hypothetical protein
MPGIQELHEYQKAAAKTAKYQSYKKFEMSIMGGSFTLMK